jgi:hypothetical protein
MAAVFVQRAQHNPEQLDDFARAMWASRYEGKPLSAIKKALGIATEG